MLPIQNYIIGVVLESGGKGIVSKTIRYLTKSKYSHVEFLYSDGQTTVGSTAEKGVAYGNISEFNNPETFLFCNLDTIIELPDKELEALQAFIDSQLGCKYDFGGIFGYLLNKNNYNGKSDWFCSEFVFEALQSIGFLLLNRETGHYVTPQNVAESLRLRKLKA